MLEMEWNKCMTLRWMNNWKPQEECTWKKVTTKGNKESQRSLRKSKFERAPVIKSPWVLILRFTLRWCEFFRLTMELYGSLSLRAFLNTCFKFFSMMQVTSSIYQTLLSTYRKHELYSVKFHWAVSQAQMKLLLPL